MNKFIWLFLFLGMSLLTGCYQKTEVMTAKEQEKTLAGQFDKEMEAPSGEQKSEVESGSADLIPVSEGSGQVIYVYVCGHVNEPGVYTLFEDARICDALEMAGGVTKDGRPEALNQAEHMTDGQTLYVPGRDEAVTVQAEAEDGLLDINRADRESLMTLPGIGESKADVIIQYREEHGAFVVIEDLMKIPGIKEGVFNKIKDKIKCK